MAFGRIDNSLMLAVVITSIIFGCLVTNKVTNAYQIGVGRADCTGPPVEIVFMGYAHISQRGQGLHLRQYARAFIVEDTDKRVVFVSIDGAMVSHPIKRTVVEKLHKLYGPLYTLENVIISGTHTHGTPGGFMFHILYDMTSFGYVPETYNALIDGIYNSIVRAHERMMEGRIFIGETEILDASINRSPTSYLENPGEERAQYKHDTDKTLSQITFYDNEDNLIGAINWFAVHPTSMNNTNRLVTTDNVGYASILLEKQFNTGHLPGRGKFVGAFAASNLGDVSPNIMGPKCEITGETCDLYTSTCPRDHGACFSSGPGRDHFESTKMIATRLFEGAMRIINSDKIAEVTGNIKYIHQFINMPAAQISIYDPISKALKNVTGCEPAMGYSFAAGTTDGPGAFDFHQGTLTDNPMWNAVRDFLATPTIQDITCQSPKPILLSTGRARFPYEWQPKIVSTQLIQIGQVIVAAVPAEFTTMSGRRLRKAVSNVVMQASGKEPYAILAGLANMYTSYVATPEEYMAQRYEAASTIYGRYTLPIYLDQFERLADAMTRDEVIPPGPTPPFMDNSVMSFQPRVWLDTAPFRREFGDVTREPRPSYQIGDLVSVEFISGNPRNDLQHDKTYFTVEYLDANGNWEIVASDSDWDTWFTWQSTSFFFGHSLVEVFWRIGNNVEQGTYHIRHTGTYKHFWSGIHPYVGTSQSFKVNK